MQQSPTELHTLICWNVFGLICKKNLFAEEYYIILLDAITKNNTPHKQWSGASF